MKSTLLAALATAVSLSAWAADPPAKAQPASLTQPAPTEEQVVAEFRSELMARRADVMAKGLTLNAEQAAKFWPLFEQFQKEQDVLVQDQIQATDEYARKFQTLTDADALAYVSSLLARDNKMTDLRIKWLAKFQAVIPPAMAARAIQLDRRLSNVTQVQLSQRIPLIH